MENGNKNNQLQIELKEEVAQGTYANLAIITHSTSEFVLDFVRIMPGLPKANVQSRIVMTPEHAKRLMYALQDNVNKYEKNRSIFMHCAGMVCNLASRSGPTSKKIILHSKCCNLQLTNGYT